jgi:hypothetical protein
MKDIVIHVREEICARYNRDPEAKRLIEVAKEFGSVELLYTAMANERAAHERELECLKQEHAAELAKVRAELDACAEHQITPVELEVLRIIRKKASMEAASYEHAIKVRDDQIAKINAENEARMKQIKSLLNG